MEVAGSSVAIIEQVAALTAAHQAGLIRRDVHAQKVKPA